MGSQIVRRVFGRLGKIVRSENLRLALPFALAVLGGIAVAWAAPRFPYLVALGFLTLALTCAVFAAAAFISASSLRHALITESRYLRDPVGSDRGQTSSFVRWFLAHNFAWAAGCWLVALLVLVGLGNFAFGRAILAAFSGAGIIFLGSALYSAGYALRYYDNHFGMGWALPSPYEIHNPLLSAAATIFLSTRHKTVQDQDLATPNSLVRQYVGFDAVKNKAQSVQGPDIKPQEQNGRKETLFRLATSLGQLIVALIVALLLLGFDSSAPAPFSFLPGAGPGRTAATPTLVAQGESTETRTAAAEQTEQAQQTPSADKETQEPKPTPSPSGGPGQAQQTPSPSGATVQTQQSPSPNGGTREAEKSPSPNGGTGQAQQTPSPSGGTGQAEQTPSPNGGTGRAEQTPSPGQGTGQAQQTPSPNGGTGQAQQTPSPGNGTGTPQTTSIPGGGSGTRESQTPTAQESGTAPSGSGDGDRSSEGTPETTGVATRTRIRPVVPFPPTAPGAIVTIALPTPRGTRTPRSTITAAPGTSVAITPGGTVTLVATPVFTPGATPQPSSNPLQVLPNWILTLFK